MARVAVGKRAAGTVLLAVAVVLASLCSALTEGVTSGELSLKQVARITAGRNGSPIRTSSAVLYRNGAPWCSASLIASNWVLSAAHCGTGPFVVYVTGTSRRNRGIRRTVARVVRHPAYRREVRQGRLQAELNDIMLIQLRGSVRARPITLARGFPRGRTMLASGYGRTSRNNAGSSGTLRHAPGMRAVNCRNAYRSNQAYAMSLRPNMHICASVPRSRAGICSGDSGGPLVARVGSRWVQYGISSQSPCGSSTSPDVFTRVGGYERWIRRVVGRSRVRFA